MGAPARFLFDNDFAVSEAAKSSVTLTDHAAKLAEAEKAGYRNGTAAAKTDAEQRAAAALERIVAALDALNRGLFAVEARLAAEAVAVAVTVGKKLAPALMAREPFAEISALARDCFRHLVAAPHVVVRVNDALHAQARDALEQTARASDSRLVVLAEPDIPPGDCRIEWADGGIKRDGAAIEAAIDEAVARYIAGRNGETYMPDVVWNGPRPNGANGMHRNGGDATQTPIQHNGANGIHRNGGDTTQPPIQHNGAGQIPDVSWSKKQ
jgi:flagellar assembly protein FliH